MGMSNLNEIQIEGNQGALDFGKLNLQRPRWYFPAIEWISKPLNKVIHIYPQVEPSKCIGCGKCAQICPPQAITPGKPPFFDLDRCISCFCCAEICPQGAIVSHRNWIARFLLSDI